MNEYLHFSRGWACGNFYTGVESRCPDPVHSSRKLAVYTVIGFEEIAGTEVGRSCYAE